MSPLTLMIHIPDFGA